MREMLERQQKEGKNGNYSQQLKRQLDDLHAREAEYTRSDVHFTQDYFGHRMFEKDEARKQANVAKIEGFRPLITADIAFKNKIREEEVSMGAVNDVSADLHLLISTTDISSQHILFLCHLTHHLTHSSSQHILLLHHHHLNTSFNA